MSTTLDPINFELALFYDMFLLVAGVSVTLE